LKDPDSARNLPRQDTAQELDTAREIDLRRVIL
jgi:hypothetical protein